MKGSVNVVPDNEPRTSTEELEFLASEQKSRSTLEALQVEENAEQNARFTNPDGTRTTTLTAGTATPYVEILEMLPRKVEIKPGDKMKFVTRTIRDIHTVTFPRGPGSDSVDPFASFCEGTPDTPANSPFDCKTPFDFEVHILPQPMGTTVISTNKTIGSSGIIANPNATPFPKAYTFSFPNKGSFDYQCRIHDNMVGTIVVGD
jgi:plastocyanin